MLEEIKREKARDPMKFLKNTIIFLLCTALCLCIPVTSEASQSSVTISDGQQQQPATGWRTVKGKRYYYNKRGVKVTGLKTIDGSRYYFNKRGVMQTGLKKIKNKRYYFDKKNGYMVKTALYKNYIIAWNGVCHKIPNKKTGNKTKDAQRVAKLVAKCVSKKGKDIDRVGQAAFYVSAFCQRCTYTMEGSDYSQAYGVFISKKYSCAGATRALGMVLGYMGYKWKHANANQYTHQWCILKMDGKKGYADGQVGWVGYGKHP